MLDLAPIIAFTLGLLASAAALFMLRTPQSGRSSLGGWLLGGAGLVALLCPYLLVIWLPGDPDVWDFYRSVWIAPAVTCAVMLVLLLRKAGVRSAVA